MTIVEPFTSRHAVQLAGIRSLGVRHPIVVNSLEWCPVEVRALLLSKVGLAFRAVLSVARKVFLAAALAVVFAVSTLARLVSNAATARSRAFRRRAPLSPIVLIPFAIRQNVAFGQI